MKVIRVTNKYQINPHSPVIEIGTEANVVGEKILKPTGELMYQVDAVPPQIIGTFRLVYWYDAKGFATLPSTTEEIAVECEREAIIYQR